MKKITEDILRRYLEGKTKETENELIRAWLEADENNYLELDKIIAEEGVFPSELFKTIDNNEQNMWESIVTAVDEKAEQRKKKIIRIEWYVRAAAVLVLCAFTGYYTYVFNYKAPETLAAPKIENWEMIAANESGIEHPLFDKTIIKLDPCSKIIFASRSLNDKRIIYLNENAEFIVSNRSKIPVEISYKNLKETIAFGTFKIKASENQLKVEMFN